MNGKRTQNYKLHLVCLIQDLVQQLGTDTKIVQSGILLCALLEQKFYDDICASSLLLQAEALVNITGAATISIITSKMTKETLFWSNTCRFTKPPLQE